MQNSLSTVIKEGTGQIVPQRKDSFDSYGFSQNQVKHLIDTWGSDVIPTVEMNRKLREYEFDIEQMRADGKIAPDSTYIPVRAIDLAVKRVAARPLSFVNTTKHLITFESEDEIGRDDLLTRLAKNFTRGFRYKRWLLDHMRWIDSAAFNGLGFMEVELDVTKPLDYALCYVENTDIMFPKDTKDSIQNAEYVIRRYTMSITKLRETVDEYGFSNDLVDKLIKLRINHNEQNETVQNDAEINTGNSNIVFYKLLFKDPKTNYVQVAWLHPDLDEWLKAPEDLYLGRDMETQVLPQLSDVDEGGIDIMSPQPPELVTKYEPMPETEYPIFQLSYEITEDTNLFSAKGLAKKFEPTQEAQSTLVSAYINGAARSVEFVGSPKEATDVTGSEPKQLNKPIETGKMMDRPMNFTSLPSPDPNIINGVKFLQQIMAEDTGDIAFTVSNRPDARKTAKEMQVAQSKEEELKSDIEALTLLSYEDMFTFVWDHVLNRAQNDKVILLTSPDSPASNDPVLQRLNVTVLFSAKIELIERAQQQQQLRNDLQIFQGTPAAELMMQDIIKGTYPEDAQRYLQSMQVGAAQKQLIAGLVQILESAITPEELKSMPPQQQEQVKMLIDQAKQMSGAQ